MKMQICRKHLLILSVFLLLGAGGLMAQQRLNDKDVEETMKNLNEDAEQFRSQFDSAVSKSTIRNTDQEKQTKALVEHFQKKTEDLVDHFKDTTKAHDDLLIVRNDANKIDKVLSGTHFDDPELNTQWVKIKSELRMISGAYGIKE
jgi:adenylate kinase family enzyme